MTAPDAHEETVRLAAEAGVEAAMDHRVSTAGRCACGEFAGNDPESIARHAMTAILTAAAPVLLAAERARIAAKIDQAWAVERDRDRYDGGYRDGYLDGLEHAQRIAEEQP